MPPSRGGRPRRWCSDRCREQAKKARKRAANAWQPWTGPPGELPTDPVSRRRELVEDLLRIGAGERPRAPVDQIALALIEFRQLLWTMRRAAAQLEPSPAAAKVHRAAEQISAVLDEFF